MSQSTDDARFRIGLIVILCGVAAERICTQHVVVRNARHVNEINILILVRGNSLSNRKECAPMPELW